jgi:hypothetical protein
MAAESPVQKPLSLMGRSCVNNRTFMAQNCAGIVPELYHQTGHFHVSAQEKPVQNFLAQFWHNFFEGQVEWNLFASHPLFDEILGS